MRRFRLTGPDVLIGGRSFENIAGTILVRQGQLAVVADDDPRIDDLLRSPYLEEVTDAEQPTEASSEVTPAAPDEAAVGGETEGSTSRRKKPPADSGGV